MPPYRTGLRGKRKRGVARNQRMPKRYKRTVARRNRRTGGFMGIETKFLDSSYAKTDIVAAIAGSEADPTTLLSLNATAQGDGESNRDGRRQMIKSVKVHGTVRLTAVEAATVALDARTVFVACVLDTQTNGSQFNAEDVFTGTTPERPFRNMQYVDRFKVLFAKTYDLAHPSMSNEAAANTLAANGLAVSFNINKKLALPVTYTGTTGVIANISDNSIHMLAIASSASVCTLEYNARCTFVG